MNEPKFNIDDYDDVGGIEDTAISLTPDAPVDVVPPVVPDAPPIDGADPVPPVSPDFVPVGDEELDEEGNPIEMPTLPNSEEAEVYKGVASILGKEGFFTSEAELDAVNSPQALAELMNKEVQARLTDEQKHIQEYMNKGLDLGVVSKIQKSLDQTNGIEAKDIAASPEYAKRLIAEEFTLRGMDGQYYADLFEKAGTLETEGVKALAMRKESLQGALTKEEAKAELAVQSKKDAQDAHIAAFEKQLGNKEYLGRAVTEVTTEKIKSLVNTPVAYASDGSPMNAIMDFKEKNPAEYEYAVAHLFHRTNGFKDTKFFDRSAETRVSKGFKNAVSSLSASDDIQNSRLSRNNPKVIDVETIDDVIV
tara:strand:+ start:34101 stop:35192 length:1092 start_codon:yes stop_codon:yes gene_type:complete